MNMDALTPEELQEFAEIEEFNQQMLALHPNEE